MQRILLFAIAILMAGPFVSSAHAQRGRNADYELERVDISRVASAQEKVEIKIGRSAGRFNAVAVRILDRPLKVRNIVIIYGNGETQRVPIREWFDEDGVTQAIKLTGNKARRIRSIVVSIRPMPQSRSARIEVLAETAAPVVALLGSRSIRPGERRISLPLLRNNRRLENLVLRVDGQSVLLRRIEVTFGNGQTNSYRIRTRLRNGQATPPLSFDKKSRFVDNVDVIIRPLRRNIPARLTLVGQIDEDAARRQTYDRKPKVVKKKAVRDEWVLLGAQKVKRFRSEIDVFPVGRAKGRFKAVRITAKRHDIRMSAMRVRYGNGSIEDVSVSGTLRDGTTSQPFNLKGRKRFIQDIIFRYKTKFNFKGSAVVELWGLRSK